ncbi:ABC-2 type transport system permease protein [Bacillus pakistanensis]|uniref:ABC-2 type transport system permease protein n=1 Tax=Rossellomorea pakistanensis TaxID=992288 RepID=A0ABS2N7G2_9BACI|nr:ABC transporter permease subunit [Bacillus pakistanensis]MBM7583714.1 ABC-2 type transport system permease protein [Bacillus pakistanensis]
MWAICLNEFRGHFKSIKSLIVVAMIFGITYLSADLMETVSSKIDIGSVGNDVYAIGTILIVYLLGFFFITGLSHDQINREVTSRTIRFLVTKTSKTNILLGKYIGILFFWLFCMTVSFILISLVSKDFLWLGLLDCMTFLSVALALNLIFSIILPKPAISMFFGIIFALLFPALSVWSIYTDRFYVSWFKFFTPYYYSSLGEFYILINLVYAGCLLLLAIWLFKRRDL